MFSRVDVTNEDHTVHTTKPFEFLDSPEWASSKFDEPTTYDVSYLMLFIHNLLIHVEICFKLLYLYIYYTHYETNLCLNSCKACITIGT